MKTQNFFGTHLKEIRSNMNLSQEELAFRCNMQASHIGQLERGVKSPTLDTLEKISNGLNITVSQLTDYSKNISLPKDETINKINAYLSQLNDKQKKQVLNIIKTFFD